MPERSSWFEIARHRSVQLNRERRWHKKDKTKIVLFVFALSTAALVIFFMLLEKGEEEGTNSTERITSFSINSDGILSNSSLRTIYDELTISNYTDAMMTTENPVVTTSTLLDEKNLTVESSQLLFYVLDKNRGDSKGAAASQRDYTEDKVYSGRRRIMNKAPVSFRENDYKPHADLPPSGLYEYTPSPTFTEPFAQIEAYKTSKQVKSVQDVLQYLRRIRKGPKLQFKFAGIYVRPADSTNQFDPRPFNGHAYISHPFAQYKPDELSEINEMMIEEGRASAPKPSMVFPTTADESLPQTQNSHTGTFSRPTSLDLPTASPTMDSTKIHEIIQKPISVMLDIYPVTTDSAPGKVRTGAIKPRKRASAESTTRMLLHLNLFPKGEMTAPRREHRDEESGEGKIQERSSGEEEIMEHSDTERDDAHNCTTKYTATIQAPRQPTTPLSAFEMGSEK